MTTKTLTGTYVSGYLLQSPTTTLRITAAAYVEGSGITTPAGAANSYTIINAGRIVGTAGGGTGISLTHGGAVTNDRGGYIFGERYGVSIQNAPGRVINRGSIIGQEAGLYISAGGRITNGDVNDAGALIKGVNGVLASSSAATVINFGTVAGSTGRGVNLGQGGVLTNGAVDDTTALISGAIAVEADNASSRITNFATIDASFAGIFSWGGTVSNGSATDTTAEIEGEMGVLMSHTVSRLTNFGTIAASGPYQGVYLQATGLVTNGSAADTSALIESRTGTGVRTWEQPATIRNFGTISAGASYAYAAGVFESPNGELDLTNGSASDGQASIVGYNGVILMRLARSQIYSGIISGFSTAGGTSLDLEDVGFVSANEATFSGTVAGGVLTVSDGEHTAHIDLAGDYLESTFIVARDGHGGVSVVASANAPTTHTFVAAMAGLGARAAGTAFVTAGPDEPLRLGLAIGRQSLV